MRWSAGIRNHGEADAEEQRELECGQGLRQPSTLNEGRRRTGTPASRKIPNLRLEFFYRPKATIRGIEPSFNVSLF